MPAESAYSPKRVDVVQFRMVQFQQLIQSAFELTFTSPPVIPVSGLLPWWLTVPSNTEFILQPGLYAIGFSWYYLVTALETNGAASGARAALRANAAIDAWSKVATHTMDPGDDGMLNRQFSNFGEFKKEFSVVSTIDFQSQATGGGNGQMECRAGSYVYFVRYN